MTAAPLCYVTIILWSKLMSPEELRLAPTHCIQIHFSSYFKWQNSDFKFIKSTIQSSPVTNGPFYILTNVFFPHQLQSLSSAALCVVLLTAAGCQSSADGTREGSGPLFDLSLVFILHRTSSARHKKTQRSATAWQHVDKTEQHCDHFQQFQVCYLWVEEFGRRHKKIIIQWSCVMTPSKLTTAGLDCTLLSLPNYSFTVVWIT